MTALRPGTTLVTVSTEGKSAATPVTVVPLGRNPVERAAPKPDWIWCDDFEQDRLKLYSDYRHPDSFGRLAGLAMAARPLTRNDNDFTYLNFVGGTWSKTPLFAPRDLGKWYCVEARAKLNDPGRSNGVFELWIDDRPEARIGGLGWMGSFGDYGINAVYVENYWNEGAPQPQDRYFDNLVISTERIGCR